MTGAKKLLLVSVALVTFLTGCIYIAGMQVERSVLNTDFYDGLLKHTALGSALQTAFTSQMQQQMEDAPPVAADLMVESMSKAVTAEWIEKQLLIVVDDALAMVDGQQETLMATIELENRKQIFKREFEEAVEALSEREKEQLGLEEKGSQGDPVDITEAMDLPDDLPVAELLEGEAAAELETVVSGIQKFRSYFAFIPYAAFLLLMGLFYLLAGASDGLKWFGASATIAAVIFILGLLVTNSVLLPNTLGPHLVEDAPIDVTVVESTVDYTVGQMYTFPIYFAIFGLLLFAAGFAVSAAAGRG